MLNYLNKSKHVNKDDEYFSTVDPNTGKRFDIPMLSTSDPNYFVKYVEYMKIREKNPTRFKKILNWD